MRALPIEFFCKCILSGVAASAQDVMALSSDGSAWSTLQPNMAQCWPYYCCSPESRVEVPLQVKQSQ